MVSVLAPKTELYMRSLSQVINNNSQTAVRNFIGTCGCWRRNGEFCYRTTELLTWLLHSRPSDPVVLYFSLIALNPASQQRSASES